MKLSSKNIDPNTGEVSFLAVVETALAASISVTLLLTGHGRLIYAPAIIAPFLLLRTKRSTHLALEHSYICYSYLLCKKSSMAKWLIEARGVKQIQLFERWVEVNFFGVNGLPRIIKIPLDAEQYIKGFVQIYFVVAQIIVFNVTKIYSTIWVLLRYPLETLSSVADNWRRIVFQTDSLTVPEYIAGIEKAARDRTYDFGEFVLSRRLLERPPLPFMDMGWPIFVLVPAYAYRWSLKSTVWVWSALLWVVRPIRQADDIHRFMKGMRDLAVSRWMWWYSLAVLFLFLLKIYIYNFATHLACSLESYPAWSVAKNYALLDGLPPWQIAAAINSGFTVLCFFVVDYLLHEMEAGRQIGTTAVQATFRWSFMIRNVLGIYIGLCTAYITAQTASKWRLPPLADRIFPWQ